jgi:hypothetical protein
MAFCGSCGNALTEGQRFCPACGQPVGAAPVTAQQAPPAAQPVAPAPMPSMPPQAGYAPPPPGYAQPPAYPQGYGQQAWGAQPAKRSRKGLWIGLASAVVVIAVACVLVFVVFKGDIFGGGAASTPEGTVKAMLSAFERKDADALFGLLDPEALDDITGFMTEDDFKTSLSETLADMESVKFSDIDMDTEDTGEGTATVTIVSGSVAVTQDGETQTEDVTESDEPVTFDLVERDGSWYLDPYSIDML